MFEREYRAALNDLWEAGDIAGFEEQQSLVIESPLTGDLICRYLCDFKVTHLDGTIEWIETKHGHQDVFWQLKKKLMQTIYVPMHPEEIFSIANRRSNGKPDYLPFRRPPG